MAAGSKSNPDRHVKCAKCNYRYHNRLGDGRRMCERLRTARVDRRAVLAYRKPRPERPTRSASIPVSSPSIIVSLASASPPIARPSWRTSSWARASTPTVRRSVTSRHSMDYITSASVTNRISLMDGHISTASRASGATPNTA